MSEKQLVDEINRVKKEKLECCECLDDLRRKWFENDKKLKECEVRKNLLTEKLTCLQRLKEDLIKRVNQLLRDENGINLIKQLSVLRPNEKEVDNQIETTKLELFETKEKSKYYIAKANELRKLIKHMQIANEKLSEKIDGIVDEYNVFETNKRKQDDHSDDHNSSLELEHKSKRPKVDTDSSDLSEVDVKLTIDESIVKIAFNQSQTKQKETINECPSPCPAKSPQEVINTDDNNNEKDVKQEVITEVTVETTTNESPEIETSTSSTTAATSTMTIMNHLKSSMNVDEYKDEKKSDDFKRCLMSENDGTQLAVVSSMNGDKLITNKWDVTTRDITVVRIVNSHIYIGCINGVISRINPLDSDDLISYYKDTISNKRVKSLFINEADALLFACFDDGLFCCFEANNGQFICEHRLKSYVVVCVEAWGEILAARGDKQISFLSLTSNLAQLRKINVKGRFQAIIGLQPLDEENGIRRLLILGKGWKPVIVNAMTGEYLMALANQAIYSPAFTVLCNSIICTAFTQSPESLKYKDSILSFYNVSKTCERIKMEFMNGCVTAMKINGCKLLIALLRFNFTRLLCYEINEWKLLWVTLIGYERVFALDFNDTSIYFGCRNGCVHLINYDDKSPFYCVDNHCNCKQPFALQSDLRHTRFH